MPAVVEGEGESQLHFWEIGNKDVVVIPSITFDQHQLSSVNGVGHYEERMLYVLLALSYPNTRITFVTSTPLDNAIFEYYFSLLPDASRINIHERINFLSVCDSTPGIPLSQKILDRPRLLNRMKHMVNPKASVLNVNIGTSLESQIAKILNIPLYAARPEHQVWGSKAGSRSLFRDLEIPCADGTYEACRDIECFITEILKVIFRKPYCKKGVVKLTEGFSGKGNAIISLKKVQELIANLPSKDRTTDNIVLREAIRRALESMNFCCHDRTWYGDFKEAMEAIGGIFEVFICGNSENARVTSPSVQMVVNEDYTVDIISTHEQILDGQIYMGCQFPSLSDYRTDLMQYAFKVGHYFAKEKVTDHFSIDFMCVENITAKTWDIYAVEINLRITGTTHPLMTLKLLTNGYTDLKTGLFLSPCSDNTKISKYYVASDNICDPFLKRLVPRDLLEIFHSRSDLHWCPNRKTGVVFHMISCMSENGKIGMTAIENTAEEARNLFDASVKYLLTEASKCQQDV